MDDLLDFGDLKIGRGRAFVVGDAADSDNAIAVRKYWAHPSGRAILIEEVDYTAIEPLLNTLTASAVPPVKDSPDGVLYAVSSERLLPPIKLTKKTTQPMKLASAPLNSQGVLLDYALLSSTNTVLKADTTYLVSGSVSIDNLVIEGGTCVKSTNSASAKITVIGTVDCQTGPYRPAVFTHYLDGSVGESIATGTITNYYGTALAINDSGNTLHDLRFSYAASAVTLNFGPGQISLTHLQFVSCGYPLNLTSGENTILMDNALCYAVTNVIRGGYDNILRGQHLTVNQCQKLFKVGSGNHNGEVYLTNSLLAEVSQLGDADVYEGSHNGFYNCTEFGSNPLTNASNPFQTVGAASHYLVDGSTNRNAGTTNISTSLLAALQKKTTYPPVEITTNLTGNTTLAPQAQRDTDFPDLGYSYDPLDYVVSGRTVSANLMLTNGVALGTYGASSSYGLGLSSGSFVSEGTPTRLNWIVRYNTVQEQSTTNWSASSVAAAVKMLTNSPTVNIRFTGWSLPGGTGDHFNDTTDGTAPTAFAHSQFGGGKFTINPGSVALTNCVWERVYVKLEDNADDGRQWYLFNNLFYGGTLNYRARGDDPVLRAYDNLFDGTTITKGISSANFTHDYNGYVTNKNRLTSNGAHDVILTNSPTYVTLALGKYYYLTDDGMMDLLINAGSRLAADAGLYHYTTEWFKETTTQVDIGFHYVAVNICGEPIDTDLDGLPDYLADKNGNGTVDAGETDWGVDTDLDGLPDAWETRYFGNLNQYGNDDVDGDGLSNLQEYNAHSNPANNLFAWGFNANGESTVPFSLSNAMAMAVAGGLHHSFALKEDGTIVGWGTNDFGQLSLPASATNVIAIAAGDNHSLALKSNGTVVAWGRNDSNQTNAPSLTNIIAIAAGGNQSLALRSDGTVTNWGESFGNAPADLTNAMVIACGTNFSVALRSNSTVVAWGNNANGQTNVPSGLTNVVAIAAAGAQALALRSDGTVTNWGATAGSIPSNLTNGMSVAAGYAHSLALRNDGTVIAWGNNSNGQTNVIENLSAVKSIAAGGYHSLAAKFSTVTQYPIDVSKDLLLIYNTNSLDSSNVWSYYMQHRPMVSNANVLGN